MNCSKCGSPNMTAQVVTSVDYKKGHGCLWTVLFGIFYWTWLIIKWIFKLIVAFFYFIFIAWIRAIIAASKKRPFSHPDWYRKMMQRRGKTYNNEKTVFVCNNCGNRQDA